MKIIACTLLALVFFASNSVLCRLALAEGVIDAASFTNIRLLSGAIVLGIILLLTQSQQAVDSKGSWKAGFMLFVYAAGFSYAYISLDTGIGALILFTVVQITMIAVGLFTGKKLHVLEWLGVLIAFAGFVYLILPDLTSPSLVGFILMSLAGVAWGFYTLAGQGSANPLRDTLFNFVRTLPFVAILFVFALPSMSLSTYGVVLAVLSGGIASGVGYTLWYVALGGLTSVQAGVLQLLVPVIAAIGGVIFANEALSSRLVIASLVILGGLLVVILSKHSPAIKQS